MVPPFWPRSRVMIAASTLASSGPTSKWAADIASGRDSVMIGPTNDLTKELNDRARLDRLAAEHHTSAATVTLGDGTASRRRSDHDPHERPDGCG